MVALVALSRFVLCIVKPGIAGKTTFAIMQRSGRKKKIIGSFIVEVGAACKVCSVPHGAEGQFRVIAGLAF
ncbi:hypothetical protein GCM10009085_53620 [Pseudomonas avellanae]|nr:hypothetical protein GCM10009085_53620 [Pseudomonas avellanae]